MPLQITWEDIALRLALTVVASALIGLNREVHGHSAGLRTTILVGLAACIAMIQANLLLSSAGKSPDSFATMDVLRFPLGVLTGVGFIGGGAILRRGNFITGVTTAATLWIITSIGLCFGGGEIGIGCAATAIAFLTLWLLKWVERRIPREQRALLRIVMTGRYPVPDLSSLLAPAGCKVRFVGITRQSAADGNIVSYDIRWRSADRQEPPLALLELVGEHHQIEAFEIAAEAGH
jgi:putative Mg2+ transporter-C (MgtC) family protein